MRWGTAPVAFPLHYFKIRPGSYTSCCLGDQRNVWRVDSFCFDYIWTDFHCVLDVVARWPRPPVKLLADMRQKFLNEQRRNSEAAPAKWCELFKITSSRVRSGAYWAPQRVSPALSIVALPAASGQNGDKQWDRCWNTTLHFHVTCYISPETAHND